MYLNRRFVSFAVLLGALSTPWLTGCATRTGAPDAQTLATLAPTGSLRVGVYPGSPSSLVQDAKTGAKVGVAYDLGHLLAAQLGVQVKVVEFSRIALVMDAMKAGDLDFTFTNATESRAREVDFTQALIRLELGYLVPQDSTIQTVSDIDRPGVRVGVAQGSTSQSTLGRQFKHASIVAAASLKAAQDMLRQHTIDAFATNKGILFEMSDELPGSRVVAGRWGFEALAIAIPKGREAGLPYVREFAQKTMSSGELQSMVQRAGLRGTVPSE